VLPRPDAGPRVARLDARVLNDDAAGGRRRWRDHRWRRYCPAHYRRGPLYRCRMVLRAALMETVILHPGVFAGFLERDGAVGAAYRAAEGFRSVVDVAQVAQRQSGIASADVAPDPQNEDFSKRAETIGYATEGIDHDARPETVAGRAESTFCPQCWHNGN
jgi:hypothetical protein